jgi:hypothetical protein
MSTTPAFVHAPPMSAFAELPEIVLLTSAKVLSLLVLRLRA